jgi:hypothetical protein
MKAETIIGYGLKLEPVKVEGKGQDGNPKKTAERKSMGVKAIGMEGRMILREVKHPNAKKQGKDEEGENSSHAPRVKIPDIGTE